MHATTGLACAVAVTAVVFCTLAPAAAHAERAEPAEQTPLKVAVRRLTESQYRHTIADIFGPQIKVEDRGPRGK